MKKMFFLISVSLWFTACASESEDLSGRKTQHKAPQNEVQAKPSLTIAFETHQIAPTGTLDGPRSEISLMVSGAQTRRVKAKAQGFCVEDKKRPTTLALKCLHAGLSTSLYVESDNKSIKLIQESLDERGEAVRSVLHTIATKGAEITIATPAHVVIKGGQ